MVHICSSTPNSSLSELRVDQIALAMSETWILVDLTLASMSTGGVGFAICGHSWEAWGLIKVSLNVVSCTIIFVFARDAIVGCNSREQKVRFVACEFDVLQLSEVMYSTVPEFSTVRLSYFSATTWRYGLYIRATSLLRLFETYTNIEAWYTRRSSQ